VYFDGASTVHSPDQAVHRTYNVVRYSSGANRWDLLPTPDGIGSALLNYNWTLAAGRPTLVRDWFDPTRPQPDGAVLAPDGNWHLIPADPFARDKNRPFLVVVGSQLVALHGSDRTTQVAGLTMSAQGPVGHWRKLTSIRHAKPFGVHPASVDGYLVWRDLVYDPRTGRPVPTPIVLQNRPERDAEQVTGAEVPDGVVFGDRVTFSGALFDPRSGTWTDIPTPPDHETSTAKPLQPGAHRLDFAYAYLGGPEDVVRFRRGELVTTGSDSGPVTMTAESGQVDVLREAS
jgi:hypothetical protein